MIKMTATEMETKLLDEYDVPLIEVLEFLDNLRESGVTNMFGASPYIEDSFGTSRKFSQTLLGHWMETFTERHPQ